MSEPKRKRERQGEAGRGREGGSNTEKEGNNDRN